MGNFSRTTKMRINFILIFIFPCVSNAQEEEQKIKEPKWKFEIGYESSNYSKLKVTPTNEFNASTRTFRAWGPTSFIAVKMKHKGLMLNSRVSLGILSYSLEVPQIFDLENQLVLPPNHLNPLFTLIEKEWRFLSFETGVEKVIKKRMISFVPSASIGVRYYGNYGYLTERNGKRLYMPNQTIWTWEHQIGFEKFTASAYVRLGLSLIYAPKRLSFSLHPSYCQSFNSPFGGYYKILPDGNENYGGTLKIRDSNIGIGFSMGYSISKNYK